MNDIKILYAKLTNTIYIGKVNSAGFAIEKRDLTKDERKLIKHKLKKDDEPKLEENCTELF